MQVDSKCPKECIHLGKLNSRDLNNRIKELLNDSIHIQSSNPNESIKLYDMVLKLDENNIQGLIGKSNVYGSMGLNDQAMEYLKKAYDLSNDPGICINIATYYRKENKFKEAIEVLEKVINKLDSWKADYLMGDCLFMTGQYERAIGNLNNVIVHPLSTSEYKNRARATLSRIYIGLKNFDRSIQYAESIDAEYSDEKTNLIENIYFAGGRMYELLKLIDSMDEIGCNEKYMLLQCALAIKKNIKDSITAIIDDLIEGRCYGENLYGEADLISLKIILLFKQLKLKEAYEVFQQSVEKITQGSSNMPNCKEACYLVAFFLYNIDRHKSIEIFSTATGMELDDFLIGELYRAFSTIDIPPYIKAKSIEKSLQLVSGGKSDSFNRISIAADILYESGEYSQAFEMYNRLLDKEKIDMVLMNKMATCLLRQNKFEEALYIYKSIISTTNFIPSVYSGIIRCCIELRIEWLDYFKNLELEKLSFSELYDLAGSLVSAEYYDKAGYIYSFMLDKFDGMDIYSRKMVYHNMVCVYRNLREYQKGIDTINRIPPEYMSEDLLMDLGCLYYDSGLYDKSMEVFEETLKINMNPLVYLNLGILYMKIKEYESALSFFYTSREKAMAEAKRKKPLNPMEYGNLLSKLYVNISLCLIKLQRLEEALHFIELAGKIDINEKVTEITFAIQQSLLKRSKGDYNDFLDMDYLMDGCISINEGFTEDIRRLLDSVLNKIYGKNVKKVRLPYELEENVTAFLKNERRIYGKYKESIERSEGTFQRYVDNLIISFEKKTMLEPAGDDMQDADSSGNKGNILQYSGKLVEIGNNLFENFMFDRDEYIYTSLIPYYRSIKLLCRYYLYPYYEKNIHNLPMPSAPDEFKYIGIFSYRTGNETCYRVDFQYNISCSEYLFEINCHPGLRSRYLNSISHYMPWEKLMWMISGIRKKWDILDDAKSAGLLLLFFCGFKNYLGIEGDFQNRDEIIRLAGDLIHIGNERDHYIRCMLKGEYEYDNVNAAREVKEIAERCMDGLKKIKRLEESKL